VAILDLLQRILGGGDPEAQGQAQASMAMQPAINQWLQNVGEDVRQRLPTTYDPGRSFAQNALDPGGLEAALNVALGIGGGGLGTKIYRGSGPGAGWFPTTKPPYGLTESGAPSVTNVTPLETDQLVRAVIDAKANRNFLPGKGMRGASEPTPYDLAVARQRWLRGPGKYSIMGPVAGAGLLGAAEQQ
jgi:hypothetical protein